VIRLLFLADADVRLAPALRKGLEDAFQIPVSFHADRIDLETSYDAERGQYNSTAILEILRTTLSPASDDKVVAVVPDDLFIPILTFVFGEAELNGRCAVLSYHRLRNEVYGLPADPALLDTRLRKEAVHEVGHVFSLRHCHNQDCVMHTSTSVEEIDVKGGSFCDVCRSLLDVSTTRPGSGSMREP
jgi:archaemetzincin